MTRNILSVIYVFLIGTYLLLYAVQVGDPLLDTRSYRLPLLVAMAVFGIFVFPYLKVTPIVVRRLLFSLSIFSFVLLLLLAVHSQLDESSVLSVTYILLIISSAIVVLRNVKINSCYSVLVVVFFLLFSSIFIYFKFFVSSGVYGLSANIIYYPLFMAPFLSLLPSKILRNVLLWILFFLVVISLKRTAILCFVGYIIVAYYPVNVRQKDVLKFILRCILVIFLLTIFRISANFIQYDFDFRLVGDVDDISSGRVAIYSDVISGYSNFDFVDLFIGRGLFSTVDLASGLSAHNDFLEILYGFGLFGLYFYFYFLYALLQFNGNRGVINPVYLQPLRGSILMFIIVSIFSNVIFYPAYVSLFFVFVMLCLLSLKVVERGMY